MRQIQLFVVILAFFSAIWIGACGGSSSKCKQGQTGGVFVNTTSTTAKADGKDTISIRANGRDESCNPLKTGTQVTFTLSSPSQEGVGQFSNGSTTITVSMGLVYAETGVTSTVDGTVILIATIPEMALTSDPMELIFSEPPTSGYCSMSLSAVPPALIGNGSTSTTITSVLTGDDNSTITDGTEVVFTTSHGRFSNDSKSITVGTNAGEAEAVLSSEQVEQNTLVSVSASAVCNDEEGTLLTSDLDIQFLASQPTVVLTPSATTLRADGTSSVSLEAQVLQSDGTAVGSGYSISFSTNVGLFSTGGKTYTTSTDSEGKATVDFVGGLDGGTASIQATATVGNSTAKGQTSITLLGLNRVEVLADAAEVNGDGSSIIGLTAVVTLSDGSQAWQGMVVEFSTNNGSFSGAPGLGTTLSTTTDENGRAVASFLGGVEGALALIDVKAIVQNKEVSASQLAINVNGLEQVSLSAESTEILADGVSQVALEASIQLTDGSAGWENMDVVFSTDIGSFLESGSKSYATRTDSSGKAQVTFVAGVSGGIANIVALAKVGSKEKQATAQIALKALDNMNLIASKAQLLADGVSVATLTATVLLNDNNPIGSGQNVTFETNLGSFVESGTSSYTGATDVLGQVQATLLAGLVGGVATVDSSASVQSQVVTDQTTIQIQELDSIEFVSTDHLKLGIRGSGRDETTRLIFRVKNSQGEPLLAGCPVRFKLSTAQGTPTIDPVEMLTNDVGLVWTTLRSGNAVTNVTVSAEAYIPDPIDPINNPAIATAEATSPVLSIVGAKPNAGYTSFSCELGKRNQPGFMCDGLNVNCVVGLADRNSNKIGLATRVTFMIEAGSITGDAVTSESDADLGRATVIASANASSPYQPKNTTPLANPVEPSWSDGIHTYNPRDGLVTIIAVTTGEESFNDLNANGEYDQGEPYIDLGEPFIDANDNGKHDVGEVWKDSNNDGVYQGPNGTWDNDTEIWTQTWITWSGGVMFGSIWPSDFLVGLEETVHLAYQFSDFNLNPINANSTSVKAELTSKLGSLEAAQSSPPLPYSVQDSLGTYIGMRKVSNIDTLAPCCEIVDETCDPSCTCPALHERCFYVPVVSGFSAGFGGTVALVGEKADTTEPPDTNAFVQVTVTYKECPASSQNETATTSVTGTMQGCVPLCDVRECGADGCGGSCGNCPTGETCSDSYQCIPPPTVVVSPSATTLNADGVSTVSLEVEVIKGDGSPVSAGYSVTFSTNIGLFSTGGKSYSTTTDSEGKATAIFTGGLEGGTASIEVKATIGSETANGQTAITLLGLNRVEVQADAAEVLGDNSSTIGLTAVVTLTDGSQAWPGMAVEFTTNKGKFVGAPGLGTTLSTFTDDNGRATASFIGGVVGGLATVNVKAAVQTKEVSAPPVALFVNGLDNVSLAPEIAEVVADGVSQIDLVATVQLTNGSAGWENMDFVFTTDQGTFLESGSNNYVTQTDAQGKAQATFVAPTTGGTANVVAMAMVGSKDAEDGLQITLKALDNLTLVASESQLLADGVSESILTATALLSDSSPVTVGTNVTFTTDRGTFVESGTNSYTGTTDALGQAQATLLAGIVGGIATVQATATVESQSASDSTAVQFQELASIEFVSTEHIKLGIQGSGRDESTRLVFRVNNSQGEPILAGCPVRFTISSAQGNPTIDPAETVTNASGLAWATLGSGSAVANVTVTAQAYIPDPNEPTDPPIATAEATSPVHSIVGAKPNAGFTSFSCDRSNIPGFLCDGLNVNCTVGLADRNSNKIGLATRVTFMIEAGSITGDAVTSENVNSLGRATVIASANATSPYQPKNTQPLGAPINEPSWVDPETGQERNPRDGLVTIIAVTSGEEAFTDLNANGAYDSGEPFVDLGEPFVDANDNGQFDVGEVWKDSDNSGAYNGPNGVWNSDTEIWTQTWITWSGNTRNDDAFRFISPNPFALAVNPVFLNYKFCDKNFNPINTYNTSVTLESGFATPPSEALVLYDPWDRNGTDIEMRKVNESGDPCCEIVDAVCTELDEICYLVPAVRGFHYTEIYDDGTDAVLYQGPADGPAWVRVIVNYKECPGDSETLEFRATTDGS